MSRKSQWSNVAFSLKKASKEEILAYKWQQSLSVLCKNQANQNRLALLEPNEAIKVIQHSLGRAHALIKQAKEWENPCIGGSPPKNKLGLARGIMWRYVMAYCGWEQCTKNLGVYQATQDILLSKATTPILPPRLTQAEAQYIKSWIPELLENEVESTGNDASMVDFLSLRNEYKEFPNWLLGLETNLQLSKILAVLRNIVVHGSLSATKAYKWKLLGLYTKGYKVILISFEDLLEAVYPGD